MFRILALLATLNLLGSDVVLAAANARSGLGNAFGRVYAAPVDPTCPPDCTVDPTPIPGASLPITYTLTDLPGTRRYIDPAGSDAAACTIGAPCLTFSRAQAVASSGDSIVVRGGTYTTEGSTCTSSSCTAWNAETTISKSLTIVAYPGETPVFDGVSTTINKASFSTTEGIYKYAAYNDRPCTDGSGITFCPGQTGEGQNLTGGSGTAGAQVDAAWVNGAEIRQRMTKAAVTGGDFYVDPTNNRMYMLATDVTAATTIEVSNLGDWLNITAANVAIKGLTVRRYSNTGSRDAPLDVQATADNFTLEDFDLEEAAMLSIKFVGDDSDLLLSPTLTRITIHGSNWMGIAATYVKDYVWAGLKITNLDRWNEFTDSPQSGGIKTGRNYNAVITDSNISDNSSPGIWADQTNYKMVVNHLTAKNNNSSGACFFFEISDMLWLLNSDIKCTSKNAVKLSGSSGLVLVNNTIVGGTDALGVYADGRSNTSLGCYTWTHAKCANSYSSDRWCPGHKFDSITDLNHPNGYCPNALSTPVQAATTDWMPRIDMMINNIIINPTGNGLCTSTTFTAFCILATNNSAPGSNSVMAGIIHVAEPGRGIPQTVIDCNVYANGAAGRIISRKDTATTNYTNAQLAAWKSYTAGVSPAPNVPGIDANSIADPTGSTYVDALGVPTGSLNHTSACAVPVDAVINVYIPAGTKHFGSLDH